MLDRSRRQFLLAATATATGVLLPSSLHALLPLSSAAGVVVEPTRLDTGWEFRRGPLDGIWEIWRAEEAPLWQKASLPHCFNGMDACDPEINYFRGQGWYRTHLTAANPFPQGRTLLHFQGAGQTTTVWVGSRQVGKHVGGYDEFSFDITDALAQPVAAPAKGKGKAPKVDGVQVTVLCDNSPDLDRVPSDLSDFCLYGGLYRHVNLVYLPAIAVETLHVLPVLQPDGSAAVTVKARLYDNPAFATAPAAGEFTVNLEVTGPDGRTVHTERRTTKYWAGMTELGAFKLDKPSLWSPDAPSLYKCTVTLSTPGGDSRLQERFGVRQVEFVEQGPFKLNGQRILLKGTQRHADHAGVAAAMPDDQVREEMKLVKEMGANFIRLGHYQQDRLVLDLCDELGLMVWEEAPWCRSGIGGEAFQQQAKGMLVNLIDQHYNHPSIILWGLGNEDDWPNEYPVVDEASIRGFMTEMRDLAHLQDPSRMTSFRRCDFARDVPDVYSPSIWAGWYRGDYHEYEATLVKERARVKHFVHIEWGADSHAGRHAEDPNAVLHKVATGTGSDERGLDYLKTGGDVRVSRDGDWSESYACDLFDWHLKTQEKLDWLTGSAMWVFKDFASPLRSDNGLPNVN